MTRPISVSKYQASGNDFLIVDELEMSVGELDAPSLCDRWFGVGADGLIRVGRGSAAPFSFRLTNADGSNAEMSGNGMRCLGAWLRDRGHVAHIHRPAVCHSRHYVIHLRRGLQIPSRFENDVAIGAGVLTSR